MSHTCKKKKARQTLVTPISQFGKLQEVQHAYFMLICNFPHKFCGLSCILCICVAASCHTCWTDALHCPGEEHGARQSRLMCETSRAKNNRTFCSTGSAFKDRDTSTEIMCCVSQRELEWGGTGKADGRDGVFKKYAHIRKSGDNCSLMRSELRLNSNIPNISCKDLNLEFTSLSLQLWWTTPPAV